METTTNKVTKKKAIKPFKDTKYRVEAAGSPEDFKDDSLISYLTQNAEEIYNPKCIISRHDWLACQKENGQTFKRYKLGGPDI